MKYKVGDKAEVVNNTSGHNFCIGEVVRFKGGADSDEWEHLDGTDYWYINPDSQEKDLKPVEHDKPAADIASLTLDIPTEAMKEFAGHCERAAAALERIKRALA